MWERTLDYRLEVNTVMRHLGLLIMRVDFDNRREDGRDERPANNRHHLGSAVLLD